MAFDRLGQFVYGSGLNVDPAGSPLPAEQTYMQTLCDTFSYQGRDFLDGFPWKEIIPDHFRTNVSMDYGLVNLDKLLSPGLQVRCEIFELILLDNHRYRHFEVYTTIFRFDPPV